MRDSFFLIKRVQLLDMLIMQKILWKKNYYSKAEKKLKPKLNFIVDGKNLIVADNIAKLLFT
jgi:outer membrane protein assembly factor BamB